MEFDEVFAQTGEFAKHRTTSNHGIDMSEDKPKTDPALARKKLAFRIAEQVGEELLQNDGEYDVDDMYRLIALNIPQSVAELEAHSMDLDDMIEYGTAAVRKGPTPIAILREAMHRGKGSLAALLEDAAARLTAWEAVLVRIAQNCVACAPTEYWASEALENAGVDHDKSPFYGKQPTNGTDS
jgi:hypothetical protein